MPLRLDTSAPSLAIRRDAFERAQLTRAAIDHALNLTADEFRMEGALIVIGPLPHPDSVPELIERFEDAGLVYFDDFFELPAGAPAWLDYFVATHTS
jgi:hypothetical protein